MGKIYEVDPLTCPQCRGIMRIISSIEDPSVIRAILHHLGIRLVRSRPPPKIHDPPTVVTAYDPPYPQPSPDKNFYGDPNYSWDQYIQA